MNRQLYILGLIALQSGFVSPLAMSASANATPLADISLAQATVSPLAFNNNNAPSGFDGQGRPRRRTSGGARGNCGDRLVALLPGNDTISDAVSLTDCSLASTSDLGTTLDSAPTLWFHIPVQERTQNQINGELVLLDENHQVLALETITLPSESGIIGIQLSHPLEVGRSYHWVFSILQHPNSPSQNPTVEGSLRRLTPGGELRAALETARNPQARARVLAQQGIWHDALNELASLRRTEPNNAAVIQDWISYLGSVGLDAIATEPLID
ncbi:MAG: DUF928 domain-containing protein [Cyanobacteria bacterium J06635_1]